ncbi:MAG TPA: hypothetical protein VFA70_04215 [Dehalococcoidia bacterium]|nr:hypothetical protein [Dehalococcoidia bacterium]
MPLKKFFVEYDDEGSGRIGLQDDELGPLGYSYEYDAAYRRAKVLAGSGVSRVRIIRRERGAPEEVVAEVTA